MIIFRYLTREISAALGAITSMLLLIFLSNQFVHYLNKAAMGKFSGGVLLDLMAIEIPHLLAILLPLGLFLSIMIAYGRLYADNEMTVLNACGLSRSKLLGLTLPITCFIALCVGILSLWLNPQLLAYRDKIMMQTGTLLALQTTLPGRFRATDDGKKVLYVESISTDRKQMQNIFFAQRNDATANSPIAPWVVVSAQNGYETIDAKTGEQFFITTLGHRYQGLPGQKDFQIMQYGTNKIRIDNDAVDISDEQETFPTTELFHPGKNPAKTVERLTELQWRLSLPLSAFLLTLLAVPLSQIKPRQGRYSKLLPAILIYATYANLLLFARNWVMSGAIPLYIGLWWIHGLLLCLALLVWAQQMGWSIIWRTITHRN